MPIRPKLPVTEAIPEAFAILMRDVAAAIDDGDESAWMESDDLIQPQDFRGYGGLYDSVEGRYGFEYLVDDSQENRERSPPIAWDFDLNRQEIRDIANGTISRIDMWRCEPDCGRRFARSDGYCPACDFP